MINFNFLTPFQLITFVLGIVLSILTIGIVFYTIKRPSGYRNNVLKVIFTFVIPMVTVIMWFMCIFAAYNLFEKELYSILLAMACGAVVAALTYLVAWLINRKYGKTSNEEEAEMLAEIQAELDAEEAAKAEQQPVEETSTEAEEVEATEEETEVEAETNDLHIEEAEESTEDINEESVDEKSNDEQNADENKND